MNQRFIVDKIEHMDQAQENYGYFDWLAATGRELDEHIHGSQSEYDASEDLLRQELDRDVGECIYLIDQRWNHGIDPEEFYYDENLIGNFYYGHLDTLPQSGLALILALYFKYRELRVRQGERSVALQREGEHKLSELNAWFLESCQLNAIARLLKTKKEELCLEIPPYTASTAPSA
jgi:hypothetical protein